MLLFDAPDLFVKDDGLITPVISAGNWWVPQGYGAASRLYSGLPLAYVESTEDGQPVIGRVDDASDGGNRAWFIHRLTREGKVWERYGLAGPLVTALKTRDEMQIPITRGYYWLSGPGLGAGTELFGDYILTHTDEADRFDDVEPSFVGIKRWLIAHQRVHGVLWTHQDGRTAKVLRDDVIAYARRSNNA